MKVLIVDDNLLYAESVSSFLELYDIEVVGIASDETTAMGLAETEVPDVVLMDISMKEYNGIDITRRMKNAFPVIEIVMLTVSEDEQDLFAALKAGASGYLLKNMIGEDFIRKIEEIFQGEVPLAPGFARKIIRQFANDEVVDPSSLLMGLSDRQKEIIGLLLLGCTYREISVRLNIQIVTVKYHVAQMIEKLPVNNRMELIAYVSKLDREGKGTFLHKG